MTQVSTRTTVIIAAEINQIKDQTKQIMLQASIEIGRRLTEAKTMVPHGEWGNWLEQSVSYSHSTANNLMNIFNEYGADQLSLFGDNAKSQSLGNLSYSQAVALLGVPTEEREKFIEDHNVIDMSSRELQKAIKDKKELERKLKESRILAESESLEREKLAKSLAEMEKQNSTHYELAERYKMQLEEANAAGDSEEASRLQRELSKSEAELADKLKQIKKLEAELKKKPIEVPATVTIEKIPADVERELAELRAKVSKQVNMKFKLCFEGLGVKFQELLASLQEIQDPEELQKCKGAAASLITNMSQRI